MIMSSEIRRLKGSLAQRPMDERRLAYLDQFHWQAFHRAEAAIEALRAIERIAEPSVREMAATGIAKAEGFAPPAPEL